MGGILVIAEHRKGDLLDVTWEILNKAAVVSESTGQRVTAVLAGFNVRAMAEKLAGRAHKVVVVDNPELANYNYEVYRDVLTGIIKNLRPVLILIGHTTTGMDLAPALAAHLNIPLATACIDFSIEDGKLTAIRQMYNGKVNARVCFSSSDCYMVTLRPGSFSVETENAWGGEIQSISLEVEKPSGIKFIRSVEAALGEVDITQADILVSVGQGIGDKKNLQLVEELAALLGGTLSCSRPVVDKKWLPKERQVGSSGKTVKPKVYLAIGISGSFQHLMGLKGGTIIAINKDPRAPIFRVADYGIVGDLFQVVPVLKEKIKSLK